jgi:segregation and condensation protein A
MDIFDLPMVTLCDQYLSHLRAMESLDLTVAGEFFVMAATLLEIKSRLLLPAPPRDETEDGEEGEVEDPRAALVRQLLEYGRFQSIAEALRDREGERQRLFFREPTGYSPEYALPPKFGELSAEALLRTLERMLADLDDGAHTVTSVRRQKITLKMTMRQVLGQARAAGEKGLSLSELLPAPPYELLPIVLLFLSLLELLKQDQIRVFQTEFCGEIRITALPPEDPIDA